MKVYTKIVIDMSTSEIIEETSFDYHGPIAEMKGGGGGGQSYDPVYNAGMLELSKEQQQWAKEMFNQYKYGVTYDPYEMVADPNADKIINPEWEKWNKAQQSSNVQGYDSYGNAITSISPGKEPEKYIADPSKIKTRGEIEGYDLAKTTSEMQYQQNLIEANQAMLGQRSGTERAELAYQQGLAEANRGLLPQRTELESAQLSDTLTGLRERAPIRSEFYNQALTGIDAGKRMDEAQAEVEHGFKLSGESARREAMSYGGLDPSKIASISTGMNLEKAKAIAGARTGAKTTAEDEQFSRLRSAMTI